MTLYRRPCLKSIFISAIISISASIIFFSAAWAADSAVYTSAQTASAGYGLSQDAPAFDDSAGLLPFSDEPADTAVGDAMDDAEQDPDNVSPSELMNAYDDADAPDAPEAVAPLIADDGAGLEDEMRNPLTVVNSEYMDHVDRNVTIFADKMRDRFKMWLSRSGRYMDMMKSVFREKNLPDDLVYLALIESGFNPKAYSWAKASGPWQFIKSTGKKYGLKVNWWVDERRDPEKSTRAAAAYLKDLYDMFGTWSLAMAAYNAGEGKVSRAIQRNGTLDFWELRKTRSLARETREYVPRYLAAKAIAKSPESYGLVDIEYEKPFTYDVVELDGPLGLDAAAKCCGTDANTIKELNPELRRWCTPPNSPGYKLRVPKGTADVFAANYASLPKSETSGWGEYVVRRGDTLGRIAGKYHVPVSEIVRMNNLRSRSIISIGQRLMIPAPGVKAVAYADYDDEPVHSTTYRVRRGDTLSTIARRHRISISRLASINGISTRSTIYPGQRLKLAGVARASYHASGSGSGSATYRVRRGDSLYSISRRYGMSVDELASLNGISKRSILRPGQRLRVRGDEVADNT